jgi:hypothetical protein
MHNFIFWVWVKNVNKLRKTQRINSAVISTVIQKDTTLVQTTDGKLSFIHQRINFLTTTLSTPKNVISYLLNSTYTHNPHPLLLERIKKI